MKQEDTYIVLCQVRVVLLDAIIQNRNHHPLSCVALFPCTLHIQVTVVGVVLNTEQKEQKEGTVEENTL